MKHLLHHYSWLVYRFWPFLLCYALLWAGVDLAVWLSSKWLNSDDVAYSVHLWLPLGGAMVLSRALMADPVPGTVAFWRTRPPRWRSLWGSQFLFLLTVSSPPVLCWLANGWMMDNTPDQWLASLADVTLILCPLLAVATVCSFARNWYFFSIGVVAFAVCWLGGFWSLSSFGDRRWLVSNTGYAVLPRIAGLLIIVPAAACIPVWMAGLRSGKWRLRGGLLAALLIMGPFVISHFFGVLPPAWKTLTRLTITSDGPHTGTAGVQPLGDIAFTGVPAGCTAVVTENQCRITAPYDSSKAQRRENSIGRIPPQSYTLPAFTPLLPDATRWYHQGIAPPDKGYTRFPRISRDPLVLKGYMEGIIVRPEVVLDVPLKKGSLRKGGLHIILPEPAASDDGAYFRFPVEIRRTAALGGPVLSDGTYADPSGQGLFVAIFHSPRHGFAVFAGSPGDRFFFRSWQTQGLLWNLGAAMPLAEIVQGQRWTREMLDETRLLLCVLRKESQFVAEPTGIGVVLPEPGLEDGIQTQIALWRSNAAMRREAGEVILALGEPALRQMIATAWGQEAFPSFAGQLFSAAPGLLEEAARKDERWVTAALDAGVTLPARQAALLLLREVPGRLSLEVVTAAATVATPDDYHALIRQVEFYRDEAAPVVAGRLWAALQRLPGLEWKPLARRVWLQHLAMGRPIPPALRYAAAFAGEIRALTGAIPGSPPRLQRKPLGLESRPVADMPDQEQFEAFLNLIEGLPKEPAERDAWMAANGKRLQWVESLQKYQIQN